MNECTASASSQLLIDTQREREHTKVISKHSPQEMTLVCTTFCNTHCNTHCNAHCNTHCNVRRALMTREHTCVVATQLCAVSARDSCSVLQCVAVCSSVLQCVAVLHTVVCCLCERFYGDESPVHKTIMVESPVMVESPRISSAED